MHLLLHVRQGYLVLAIVFWDASSTLYHLSVCILNYLFLSLNQLILFQSLSVKTIESSPCGENSAGEAVNLSQLVISKALLSRLSLVHYWLPIKFSGLNLHLIFK